MGLRQKRMDGDAMSAQIVPFHKENAGPHTDDEYQEAKPKLTRTARVFRWLGVIMAQADIPRGWGWNPSVITLCLVILSIVASAAYYIGHLAAEVEFLKQQQVQTENTAKIAKDRADYAMKESDKGDGHRSDSNTNSNTGGH